MQYLNVEDVLRAVQEHFVPEQAGETDATVVLRITGDGGGEWTLRIAAGKLTVSPGAAQNPDLVFETSRDNFLALANRQLDPMKAYLLRKVRVEGSKSLAFHLATMFRMPAEGE